MNGCLFCKIVKGEIPSHKVYEDDNHLAFLTIFPNTIGTTVVIPKQHFPSYVFDLPENIRENLITAAGKVAKILEGKLDDVGRCGLVFEGFGVNHIHAKVYPLHGTKMAEWKPIEAHTDRVFDKYPGYITTEEGPRASDDELAKLAEKLRS
jgi:diadenosine tetraphosphate (Ap4A) HIT family hydrolase